jgi:hypothetical protein
VCTHLYVWLLVTVVIPSKSTILILNICGQHIFNWSCFSQLPLMVPSSQSFPTIVEKERTLLRALNIKIQWMLDCMLKTKTKTLFFSNQSHATKTTHEYGKCPQTHCLVFLHLFHTSETIFSTTMKWTYLDLFANC